MTTAAKTLNSALVEALSEMPNPVKNSDNPAFKRDGKPMRYADLEATLDACKPVLAACGIAVMQHPVSDPAQGLGVHTWLIGHGETMDCGEFYLPLEGQTPQKGAGAITYARRYALTALFGLAQEDDDANAASGSSAAPASAKPQGLASENQVKAMFGKAKALGMGNDTLFAAIKRDTGKEHPEHMTGAEARALLDKMQSAIDAKETPLPEAAMTADALAELPEQAF